MTPSGTLNVHAAYMELSKLLNKCKMVKASINYRDTILSIVEALEKVPEGRHATFDALTSFAMRLRQPVRQSDTASSAQLEDLLKSLRGYADTENLNRALRTPGLLPGVPAARHTYVVTDRVPAESVSRHTFVVTEKAPAEEVTGTPDNAQVMAAFTRSIPPCLGCGLRGYKEPHGTRVAGASVPRKLSATSAIPSRRLHPSNGLVARNG